MSSGTPDFPLSFVPYHDSLRNALCRTYTRLTGKSCGTPHTKNGADKHIVCAILNFPYTLIRFHVFRKTLYSLSYAVRYPYSVPDIPHTYNLSYSSICSFFLLVPDNVFPPAAYRFLSIASFNCIWDTTPRIRSVSFPSLKKTSVGMDIIPYSCAISCASSTSNL